MNEINLIYETTILFIDRFSEKYGCTPSESDKKIVAEEVVSFVHSIETNLIDRYDLDYEYK